jgi:uncharacterized RDD family membrane protein YckC
MGQGWYFTRGGQQSGPVEFNALQQMAAAGHLQPTELVWSEGMAQWSPASSVPGLMPAVAAVGAGAPLQYAGQPGLQYFTPQAPAFEYAGFWLRFVAWIVDTIIVQVISFVLGFVAGLALGAAGGAGQAAAQAVGAVIGLCVGWLFYGLLESSASQATPGKMMLGLRVTDLAGNRISFGKATGRFFGKLISGLILGIGYLLAGFTEKKQALHDSMAGCLVVRGRP